LLQRGGFSEPCLATYYLQADRWHAQYFADLICENVPEFSHLHEINTMRLFVELLREFVGYPLSLASIARDLGVAPAILKRYCVRKWRVILRAIYAASTVEETEQRLDELEEKGGDA
jgi:hypothetical protein